MKRLFAIIVISTTLFACNNNASKESKADTTKPQYVMIKSVVKTDTVPNSRYQYLDNGVVKMDTAGYGIVTAYLIESNGQVVGFDSVKVSKILNANKQEVTFHFNEFVVLPAYLQELMKKVQEQKQRTDSAKNAIMGKK